MKNLLISSSALMALAACGGGGDGSSAPSFQSFDSAPTTGEATLSGNTKSASYSSESGSSENATVGDVSSSDDATAAVRYREALLSRLAIRGSGADITIDTENGGQFAEQSDMVFGATADGNTVVALVNPEVAGFNYQSYGYWSSRGATDSDSGTVGVGSFGARTGADNMPTGTQATYSGSSEGLLDDTDRDYITSSDITASTDFNEIQVISSDTRLYDMATMTEIGTAGELDFDVTGVVTADGFTASLDSGATTGQLDGHFYGPNAEELGGTFSATLGEDTYAGAFGAAR